MKKWIVCLSLLAAFGLAALWADGNQCPMMQKSGTEKPACCSEAKPVCPICPMNSTQTAKPAVQKTATACKPVQCPFAKTDPAAKTKTQSVKAADKNTQTAAK